MTDIYDASVFETAVPANEDARTAPPSTATTTGTEDEIYRELLSFVSRDQEIRDQLGADSANRLYQCPSCQEMVVTRDIERHVLECTDFMAGRNCGGCGARFPASKIERHELFECDRRELNARRDEYEMIMKLAATPGQNWRAQAIISRNFDRDQEKFCSLLAVAPDHAWYNSSSGGAFGARMQRTYTDAELESVVNHDDATELVTYYDQPHCGPYWDWLRAVLVHRAIAKEMARKQKDEEE